MKPEGNHPWAVNPNYLHRVTNNVYPDDVVIYHNSVKGNPFNARKIIRWMLHKPKYHTNDLTLYYSEQFGNGPVLNVIEPHLDIFYDKGLARSGDCWTWRKAEAFTLKDRPKTGFEIVRGVGNNDLAEIFNKYQRFISYDGATFLSVQAALCGCDSVVLKPTGGKFPWPGVATSVQDIPKARSEHQLLRETLEKQYVEQDSRAAEIILSAAKKLESI
jgi:hypothetical protein